MCVSVVFLEQEVDGLKCIAEDLSWGVPWNHKCLIIVKLLYIEILIFLIYFSLFAKYNLLSRFGIQETEQPIRQEHARTNMGLLQGITRT